MRICIIDQLENPNVPLKCGAVRAGSSLPVEVIGMPSYVGGALVKGVRVEVTNADGVEIEAPCKRCGSFWVTLFSSTNFERYGFISGGLRVVIDLEDGDGAQEFVLGVGDFEVQPASVQTEPGDPTAVFVKKGDRAFERSRVVDGVQHYVERTLEYVEGMGWGANWTGDFILDRHGNFIEA